MHREGGSSANETVWRIDVKLRGRRSELQGFIVFERERVPQGHLNPPCVHRGLVVRLHDGFDMRLVALFTNYGETSRPRLSSDLLDHTLSTLGK